MNFWNDVPFENRVALFGLQHLMYVVSVVLIVVLFILFLDKVKSNLPFIRKIMIVISLIQITALYSWSFIELGFSLEAGLPIHLCRLGSFIGLYFLITEDTRVFHALYYMSAFALVAIFYPVNVHPIYTHIIGWSYQISHLMIVLVWIMGVCVYGYRPSFNVMNKAILVFLLVTLLVWQFNYFVGDGEYLYLRGDVNRPFFKEMNDLLWIGFTMVLSYIVMLFMTLPFVRGKQNATIE